MKQTNEMVCLKYRAHTSAQMKNMDITSEWNDISICLCAYIVQLSINKSHFIFMSSMLILSIDWLNNLYASFIFLLLHYERFTSQLFKYFYHISTLVTTDKNGRSWFKAHLYIQLLLWCTNMIHPTIFNHNEKQTGQCYILKNLNLSCITFIVSCITCSKLHHSQ